MVTIRCIKRLRIKELEAIAFGRMSQDVIVEHLNKADGEEYTDLMSRY